MTVGSAEYLQYLTYKKLRRVVNRGGLIDGKHYGWYRIRDTPD